jgi:hypothetical protein
VSLSALNWAFDLPMIDPAEKAVLVALANHADGEGKCWPSAARLQRSTAFADRTVRGVLIRLAAIGAIHVEARPGRSPIIVLQMDWAGQDLRDKPRRSPRTPAAAADVPRQEMPGLQLNTPAGTAGPPRQLTTPPRQELPDTPAAAADEPSRTINREPSDEPSARRKSESRGTRLPADWQPEEPERQYASDRGLDPDTLAEEFRNYWIAIPGARGRKLDWPATFRNRCIQQAGQLNGRRPSIPGDGRRGNSVIDAARRMARDIGS